MKATKKLYSAMMVFTMLSSFAVQTYAIDVLKNNELREEQRQQKCHNKTLRDIEKKAQVRFKTFVKKVAVVTTAVIVAVPLMTMGIGVGLQMYEKIF